MQERRGISGLILRVYKTIITGLKRLRFDEGGLIVPLDFMVVVWRSGVKSSDM
jgi:hypothetical protein